MTPAAYRQGGAGTTIRYRTVPPAFGHRLVAATPRGVCAVGLGNDAAALVDEVRAHGALAGYRWGVERKRRLLERERQPRP